MINGIASIAIKALPQNNPNISHFRYIIPISQGPRVCPNLRTLPLMDMKAALLSDGAMPANNE